MYIYKLIGIDPYFILNCFFVYSFLGWIFECIVMSIEEKGLVNRGFIKGPLCTIYGAGALSVYYLLQPISHSPLALFLCGMILATLLEIVTAKIMTHLFGDFWWDYNSKPFNYKGVICLESSICWGFMTVAMFMFINPAVESLVKVYYESIGKPLVAVIAVAYCIDFSTSFYKAYCTREDMEQMFEMDLVDMEPELEMEIAE